MLNNYNNLQFRLFKTHKTPLQLSKIVPLKHLPVAFEKQFTFLTFHESRMRPLFCLPERKEGKFQGNVKKSALVA